MFLFTKYDHQKSNFPDCPKFEYKMEELKSTRDSLSDIEIFLIIGVTATFAIVWTFVSCLSDSIYYRKVLFLWCLRKYRQYN